MPLYEPPPVAPRILYHFAHAVLGCAMLAGLLTAIWLAVYSIAAIVGAL
jgi:hypothetical protein